MADFDAQSVADHAVLIGLITREQAYEAIRDARDGSIEELGRVLIRKQALTSWQFDKLKKGETQGFFFGDCVVMFHLAEGTFARVYRARKQSGNQSVAVKVLRQRFVSDRDSILRFNKEAEAGLRIVHPNIVRIFDYGEQDRRHYMSMEYVEGSNLRDFLKFRNRLHAGEALPLMIGLARGLQYSLAKGVTHRDLKPSNILISSNGVAKLVDFGLATIEGDDKKSGLQGQRTVDYSNLERTCGSAKGDPRSDIFFMGCVYYQMICGQNPMPEADSKDLLVKMLKRSINAIKPLSEHRHAPPPGLSAIVERMMRVDLKARYQTMDSVVADLEAFQADASSKRPATTPAPAPPSDEFDTSLGFAPEDDNPDQDRAKEILCVEGQAAAREAMSRALEGMGYRVRMAANVDAATRLLRDSPIDALLFDADGIGPNGVETFLRFRETMHEAGQDPITLVLIGTRQGEIAGTLPEGERLNVLAKPLKLREIQEALRRLVPVE